MDSPLHLTIHNGEAFHRGPRRGVHSPSRRPSQLPNGVFRPSGTWSHLMSEDGAELFIPSEYRGQKPTCTPEGV